METVKLTATVKAAQSGDNNALETLYKEYARQVYFLSLKLLKNKEDSEDIAQEVFIHVFQKIGELSEAEAFPAWLNRITTNKCTDFLRKRREPIDLDSEELEESA
ncbi:MAG: sigma-70 family RNA polymerase sigma factor, partial [Oscillospiraceae bacterium]|nr:sigma-70 family RNA polymerase sigma factor [Oscillospiraceae bacterium]